jgi:HD-GYP domain-containing protein (c-di-GMP phosphodiesterase class II)
VPQVSEAPEIDAILAYRAALDAAAGLWRSAVNLGRPAPAFATSAVEGLADAMSLNPASLCVLATLEHEEDFTFTHMVNVSILTMAQAHAAGIGGTELREFGIAALLHDIGKIRTPPAILSKPGKLTDEEFAVVQRHTTDGETILKTTAGIPELAGIVALEHHLRLDGTGYPRVSERPLHLASMMCSISDVYDAMHSRRSYQPSYPVEAVFEVLRSNERRRFDQQLVGRFEALVGSNP